jgi:membrane-bound serine protease (ClpP class)
MDSTLARKVDQRRRGVRAHASPPARRNARGPSDAVRHAVPSNETEAVKLDVVDFLAARCAELLARADGRTWRRAASSTSHVRRHAGRPHRARLPPAPARADRRSQRRLHPHAARLLRLLFELQNPGAILPGVVGGICLILAFLALSVLPVNYAGVALIVLAIVFFIAEIKVASHGVLARGGRDLAGARAR